LLKKAKAEKHLIVEVGFLREISELPELKKNPVLDELGIPMTYIPSRNTIFFSIASYFSEIIGAKYIVTGHCIIDPFPDCKPKYVKAINTALFSGSRLGKEYRTKIVMPFTKMDKTAILKPALELGVPLELTWSCHGDGKIACSRCSGCIRRLKAFEDLDLEDKIMYQLISKS